MLRCNRCKKNVDIADPVISKLAGNKYILTAKCLTCNKPITRSLTNKQIKLLPKSIVETSDYGVFRDYKDEKSGGILPLLPLLGAIFGGLTAASGVAGTVANSVLQARKNEEQERHNREVERIAKGEGVSLSLDDIVQNVNSLTDDDKRKLIQVFHGLGFVVI
jgi:hypothetical protein